MVLPQTFPSNDFSFRFHHNIANNQQKLISKPEKEEC